MATKLEPQPGAETGTYTLEGTILEACSCNVLCPCWVGEDPDGGTCNGMIAWHVDRGQIAGVDVSGRTVFGVAHIPGNVFAGGARLALYVDDGASGEQVEVLGDCFSGKLGGPLEELIGTLIGESGELLGVFQAPISYDLVEVEGTVRVGDSVRATMAPFRSHDGAVTTLRDSAFSTIPGAPAWVGKASEIHVDLPEHGFRWDLEGTNAIQGEFRFQA